MTTAVPRLRDRASGLLLHVTSLPGAHGCGDLGVQARAFADFLVSAEQSFWQMLPVGPCGYGNSPYSSTSAFAGNPLLLALEPLVQAGHLPGTELDAAPPFPRSRVDYDQTERFRTRCLRIAFEACSGDRELARFCEQERGWLHDYALYRALKTSHGEVEWTRWQPEYRDRKATAIQRAERELADEIAFRSFEQWLFAQQWRELRAHCAERGIALIGDLPIFLAHDSADVWQHRELFHLDPSGMPTVVAGVPPDYFSATGQRWGNPLYRWPVVRESGYRFFTDRMRTMLSRFDIVRLDHFIGFERYWEIPAGEPTAVRGSWRPGPGAALFHALAQELEDLPLIAEDLGEVTPEVRALRDQLELPGTKILQFAFGTDPNAHDFLPHNYSQRAVVYTGTHDNDTAVGWFLGQSEGDEGSTRSRAQVAKEQAAILAYLGRSHATNIHWDMIRACMMSVASTTIFPLQDVLGLGSGARMNRPGRAFGNWEWRAEADACTAQVAAQLAELTRVYDRQRVAHA